MESWGVVFLGVIAVASLVQAAFMVGLAIGGVRLARRLAELSDKLDREIKPALDHVTRVSQAAAEIADLATLQARRLDLLLADTVEKIEETTGVIQQLVVRPLKPVGAIVAFMRGLQRGMETYMQLGRGSHAAHHSHRRRSHTEDDEHLFI